MAVAQHRPHSKWSFSVRADSPGCWLIELTNLSHMVAIFEPRGVAVLSGDSRLRISSVELSALGSLQLNPRESCLLMLSLESIDGHGAPAHSREFEHLLVLSYSCRERISQVELRLAVPPEH